MDVLVLQNSEKAPPGNIIAWAETYGHHVTLQKLYSGDPIIGDQPLIISLGGVPAECETWMEEEKRFISEAVGANKGVLGICLGSQILAEALGGRLVPHFQAECGWWPLTFNTCAKTHSLLEGVAETELFFFHKNTVQLPSQFSLLASTEACKNQVFVASDRVIGIQGHPEVQSENVRNIVQNLSNYSEPGPYVVLTDACHLQQEKLDSAKAFLWKILNNLVLTLGRMN